MTAAAIRAPLSSDMLVKIAVAGAGLFAAWWLYTKAKQAAADLADLPGSLYDKVKQVGTGAVEAVSEAAGAIAAPFIQSAEAVRAAAPGAGLPAGWYSVKTWQGPIITQHPDAYKSLNRWDSVLVDP